MKYAAGDCDEATAARLWDSATPHTVSGIGPALALLKSAVGPEAFRDAQRRVFSKRDDSAGLEAGAAEKPRQKARGYLGLETAAAFSRRWQPPQYIVDGILPRGRVQALTAYTGHTKTTTALHLALCVASGKMFSTAEVEQGAVLILAGENPDLVVGQFRAACLAANIDPDALPVHFHYGRFSVIQDGAALLKDAQEIDNLALIIPDTHQAFFEGDNDNDNMQALAAAEKWRPFTELDSRPTVLIPCHPSGKKPDRDNLVPRGGSAFMNELDGNFCLWRKGDVVTFHTQGKHRGPSFEPIELKLDLKTHPEIIDSKGREIAMPVVRPMMTTERMAAEQAAIDADLRILLALRDDPSATVREIGSRVGLGKSHVHDKIQTLNRDGLIHKHARKHKLTAAGDEVLADAGF